MDSSNVIKIIKYISTVITKQGYFDKDESDQMYLQKPQGH